MAVHYRVRGPTQSGTTVVTTRCTKGEDKPVVGQRMPGSRLKLMDASGRSRLICQPSSRTGENPPYGMIGRIEETSASFEARSGLDPTRPQETSGTLNCCCAKMTANLIFVSIVLYNQVGGDISKSVFWRA